MKQEMMPLPLKKVKSKLHPKPQTGRSKVSSPLKVIYEHLTHSKENTLLKPTQLTKSPTFKPAPRQSNRKMILNAMNNFCFPGELNLK